MLRYVAGIVAALLLVSGGVFMWKSRASAEDPIPAAPPAASAPPSAYQPRERNPLAGAPAAPEKSREQQRFARADKDKDGKITLEELFQPRRKAFAKLDANGDSRLAFEEWASGTSEKFAKADADRNAWLTPTEFETTKPKTKPKPKCSC